MLREKVRTLMDASCNSEVNGMFDDFDSLKKVRTVYVRSHVS